MGDWLRHRIAGGTAAARERWLGTRALWTLLWRALGWRGAAGVLLAIMEGLAPTAQLLATGLLIGRLPAAIDGGLGSPAVAEAMTALLLLGGAMVVGVALSAAMDYLSPLFDDHYARSVHAEVAAATLGTPGIAVLEDAEVAGELASLDELERADGFLGTFTNYRNIVAAKTMGLGALVVLFTFAWWAPVVLLLGWRYFHRALGIWVSQGVELGAKLGATRMRRARYLRTVAVDREPAKEIRIFGLADWLVRGFSDGYRAALTVVQQSRRTGLRGVAAAVSVVTAGHLLVLGAASWRAAAGGLSLSALVIVLQAVPASASIGWVGDVEGRIVRARVVARRVLDLRRRLETVPSRTQAAEGDGRSEATAGASHAIERCPAEVMLRGVRFGYPGRPEPILNGLDLTIPVGQSLAIVGANGAGKSTLIKLLCGLYAPDRGAIRIDGRRPEQARERIGLIFQDFVRYGLPLRANVGFGDPTLLGDDTRLASALRDAGAEELLDSLPYGWDTVLSADYPGGVDLSGGQWHKVALARALTAVRGGAGLLILDEPMAALDVRAEVALFDRFLEVTKDVTTILVSHRLASVRHADRIVVLRHGRLVEDGSHDELMAFEGHYAQLFALQARRFAAAGDVTADAAEPGVEVGDA